MKVIAPVSTNAYAPFARASVGTYFNAAKALVTAAAHEARFAWDPETGTYQGALVEPERTNMLLNSATLSTQTRTVISGRTYTFSFYGPGTVVLSGAEGATIVCTAAFPSRRMVHTFPAAGSSLTLTVSGTVQYAQLEEGSAPTSIIVTADAPVTRAADVITGTGVFSSSFADATPLFSDVTTYALDAVVRAWPRLYKSLAGGNTGNAPATSPTWWLDIGPDNVFAAMDRQVSTASVGAKPTEVFAVKIGAAADAVALMNIDATSVTVVVSDGFSTFQSQIKTGADLAAAVLYGFAPGTVITVVMGHGTAPTVGEFICGALHTLGKTKLGFGVSIIDYSKKDTDLDTGIFTYVEGPFSKRAQASVVVAKADYNAALRLASARRGPTVWIASEDADYAEGAILYGFYNDFAIVIEYQTESLCSLEITSMI